MDPYTILLGCAACLTALGGIVSSLTQRTSNKALAVAIDEMRLEMKDHRERLGRLEERVF